MKVVITNNKEPHRSLQVGPSSLVPKRSMSTKATQAELQTTKVTESGEGRPLTSRASSVACELPCYLEGGYGNAYNHLGVDRMWVYEQHSRVLSRIVFYLL